MFSYYSAVIFIALFSMSIMIVVVQENDIMPERKKHGFVLTFSLVLVVAAAEWIGVCLDGTAHLQLLHIAAKVIEFSVTPMIPLVCASTIGNFPKKKWVMLFLLAHAFLEVLSARFGFIFCVDSSNVYHRRGFYWIYLAAIVLGTAFLFRASFQLSRHYQNRNSHVLALILVFLVVGAVIQIIWRDVRVDWISVSLASMLFYIYYSELIQQTDPLTALLNRRCYESRIAAIHSVVVILYFDVDQFKKINDRYGHACGDSCLSIIGGVLRRSYSKYGCCYRIGGDEFCVILDHHLRDVALLNTSFFSRLTTQRAHQPFLPHVSVGFAQYDPATDDIHEAIARADSCMYHYKEKHRAAPPLSS